MTILITGATGQLGRATLDFLVKGSTASRIGSAASRMGSASSRIMVLARDAEKAEDLRSKGIEVRVGDYNDLGSIREACKDVDVLLLISSNAPAGRLDQHRNVIDAAGGSQVKHIVYTSALKASENSSFEAAVDHYRTEKYLKGKGIAYTIFRNSIYTEMIPILLGDALQSGVWNYPAGDARVNFVSRLDIAEAIRKGEFGGTDDSLERLLHRKPVDPREVLAGLKVG